jgi:hypothetical protein
LLELLAWLTACGCSHVAMEATGVYWKPVWNILSEGDFELILANAAHIKNVPGRKTDVNNAMWIADLVACGLIKASFVALYASCPQQKCSRNHGPIASSVLIGARKSSSSLFREHLYPTLTPFDRMML